MKDKLNICILGSRGIPNRYGGYEGFAQGLSVRLADRGHSVTVYNTSDHPFQEKWYKNVELVHRYNPERYIGAVGQIVYDGLCNLHSRSRDFDIVLHLGYTSDAIWYKLWSGKAVHVVNMDGMEWKRAKYTASAKKFLRYSERWAAKNADHLIGDSPAIEAYLKKHYSTPVAYIPYGTEIPGSYDRRVLEKYGLSTGGYDLMIARMEPENNIEMAIEAHLLSGSKSKLVIIGNENANKKRLKEKYKNISSVSFPDAVYEKTITTSLRHFSRYYIHGHSVGGTNPSLLEAMACECKLLCHDNPFNRAVTGSDALYFSNAKTLAGMLCADPNREQFAVMAETNLNKIKTTYHPDRIADEHEKLFYDLARIS